MLSGMQSSAMQPPKKRPGKVMLEKGYSQLDWMRLQKSGKDLAGLTLSRLQDVPDILSVASAIEVACMLQSLM